MPTLALHDTPGLETPSIFNYKCFLKLVIHVSGIAWFDVGYEMCTETSGSGYIIRASNGTITKTLDHNGTWGE